MYVRGVGKGGKAALPQLSCLKEIRHKRIAHFPYLATMKSCATIFLVFFTVHLGFASDKFALMTLSYEEYEAVLKKPKIVLNEPYASFDVKWFDTRQDFNDYFKSTQMQPGNYVLIHVQHDELVIEAFVKPLLFLTHTYFDEHLYVFFHDEFGDTVRRPSPTVKRWFSVWHNESINGFRIPALSRTLTILNDSIHHRWNVRATKVSTRDYGSSWQNYKGYVVTNQPIYRHGDTLKIKGLLYNEFDAFLDEPVDVEFSTYRGYRTTLASNLKPTRKGLYELNTIIGDSLEIDRDYVIQFKKSNKKGSDYGTRNWKNKIRIEDYQLRENDISIHADKDTLYPNDGLKVYVVANDATGKSIAGARATFTATMSFLGFPESITNIAFPDTLKTHTHVTDYNGVAQLSIDKDVLDYPIRFYVTVTATITLPDGEVITRSMRINRQAKHNVIQMEERNGDLCIFLHSGDTVSAQLETNYHTTTIMDSIQLPYCFPNDRMATSYRVVYGNHQRSFTNNTIRKPIKHVVNQTSDGLEIKLINPKRIEVMADVKVGKETSASFRFTNDTTLQFTLQPSQILYLDLTYLNSRELVQDRHAFRQKDKVLNINHNFPIKTIPGKKDTAHITINDYKNTSPVSDVDITVVSFSNSYKLDYTPNLPYYGKQAPNVRNKHNVRIENDHPYITVKYPINHEWAKRFELYGKLYYDLLLQPDEKKFHYVPLADSTADGEIAIYPIRNGRFEEPVIVNINGVPEYFINAKQETYSIPVKSNTNYVNVRLFDQEKFLRVPTVKGFKTMVSFNVPTTEKYLPLSFKEKESLEKYYIRLTGYMTALKTHDQYIVHRRGDHIYGPFTFKHGHFLNVERENMKVNLRTGYSYAVDFRERSMVIEKDESISWSYLGDHSMGSRVNPYETYKTTPDTAGFFVHPLLKKLHKLSRKNTRHRGRAKLYPYTRDRISNISYYALFYHDGKPDQVLSVIDFHDRQTFYLPGRYTIYGFSFDKGKVNVYKGVGVLEDNNTNLFGLEHYEELDDRKPSFIDVLSIDSNAYNIIINEKEIGITYESDTTDKPKQLFRGRIIDEDTKEPIAFATAVALKNGKRIASSDTDFEGEFTLRIPADAYVDLELHFFGYETRIFKNVWIKYNVSHTFTLKEAEDFELEVVLSDKPLITTDATTRVTGRYDDMAVREISSVSAMTAGVYKSEGFDSSRLRGYSDIPNTSIAVGGVPAQYGDGELSVPPQMDIEPLEMDASGMRSNFSNSAIWQTNLLTNNSGEVRFAYQLPDDITTWRTHILAMDEDLRTGQTTVLTKAYKPIKAQLYTPRFALQGDSILLRGNIQNFTGERYKSDILWSIDPSDTTTTNHSIQRLYDSETWLDVPEGIDSANVFFGLRTVSGYEDGEARAFSVYQKGVPVHYGNGFVCMDDTTLTIDSGLDAAHTLEINESVAHILDAEIRNLYDYLHNCNEQMTSRLLAIGLMEKRESSRTNRRELKRVFKALSDNQNADGGWAWWGKANNTNLVMTLAIGTRLQHLNDLGLADANAQDMLNIIKSKAADWLQSKAQNRRDSLEICLLGARIGADLFYEPILEITKDEHTYHRILRGLIASIASLDVEIERPLSYSKTNFYGQMYWEANDTLPQPYFGNLSLNILAQELLHRQNAPQTAKLSSLGWILSQRRGAYFYNTVLSSDFSWLLSQYYSERPDKESSPSILVNGAEQSLPFRKTFDPNTPITTSIKPGGKPLFVNHYNTVFEESPEKRHDQMRVHTVFKENDKPLEALTTGRIIDMDIHVELDQSAEYFMLDVPIPAGCTYTEQQTRGIETHREAFRNKCVFYFEHLPKGKHTFTVSLEVRFAGSFHVNPVRLGSMYFKQIETFNNSQRLQSNKQQ